MQPGDVVRVRQAGDPHAGERGLVLAINGLARPVRVEFAEPRPPAAIFSTDDYQLGEWDVELHWSFSQWWYEFGDLEIEGEAS